MGFIEFTLSQGSSISQQTVRVSLIMDAFRILAVIGIWRGGDEGQPCPEAQS